MTASACMPQPDQVTLPQSEQRAGLHTGDSLIDPLEPLMIPPGVYASHVRQALRTTSTTASSALRPSLLAGCRRRSARSASSPASPARSATMSAAVNSTVGSDGPPTPSVALARSCPTRRVRQMDIHHGHRCARPGGGDVGEQVRVDPRDAPDGHVREGFHHPAVGLRGPDQLVGGIARVSAGSIHRGCDPSRQREAFRRGRGRASRASAQVPPRGRQPESGTDAYRRQ